MEVNVIAAIGIVAGIACLCLIAYYWGVRVATRAFSEWYHGSAEDER
jgi:hypothetical protein